MRYDFSSHSQKLEKQWRFKAAKWMRVLLGDKKLEMVIIVVLISFQLRIYLDRLSGMNTLNENLLEINCCKKRKNQDNKLCP